jgi:pimeloyl-ACP methyl ester carboxylesterase
MACCALLAAAGLGALVQVVATAWDDRRVPAPGVLVAVDGHRMHLNCTGEGGPTVVLEHGGGGSALAWFHVQPDVARVTRVCAYDRPGLGWSEASGQPRDGRRIAEDLHALVQTAGIPTPFVLAGWSYGGLFARIYAARYREDLAGLILLDATPTSIWRRTPVGQSQYETERRMYAVAQGLARLGLLRLLPTPLSSPPDGLSPGQKRQWSATYGRTRFWDTTAAESAAILITMRQADEARDLGDLPLLVVSAGANTGVDGQWQSDQRALLALSRNSAQVVVEGATHTSLWVEPDASRASAGAIIRMVDSVRAVAPIGP